MKKYSLKEWKKCAYSSRPKLLKRWNKEHPDIPVTKFYNQLIKESRKGRELTKSSSSDYRPNLQEVPNTKELSCNKAKQKFLHKSESQAVTKVDNGLTNEIIKKEYTSKLKIDNLESWDIEYKCLITKRNCKNVSLKQMIKTHRQILQLK